MPTVSVLNKQIQAVPTDALVVNLFEGVKTPGGATGAIDTALGASDGVPGNGMISEIIQLGDFKGKLNEIAVLYPHGLIPATRVILAGLGKPAEFTLDRVRQASASAVRKARDLGCKRVTTIVHGSGIGGIDTHEAAQATVEGALLGTYIFREHKANAKGDNNGSRDIDELVVVEYDKSKMDAVQAGVNDGIAVSHGINAARNLINRAPNVLHPRAFAEAAQEMAAKVGLTCTVFTETEIREHKMGGLLAVSQGSLQPPRFVIFEHKPVGLPDNEQPLVFVGKGVTFDTGGISIKPADGMGAMKGDMAGAAAVFGAMRAVAALNVPRHIIGLIPLVENMPSDRAYRPSDVITMMSGLTVEIISTDAEGRMILADALHYAKRYKPSGVIDLATLTGAATVAMGEGVSSAVFMNDDVWAQRVLRAADVAGERMWRMPLFPEYNDKIKSDVAEIKNSGGRSGGVGASAYFLKRFVEQGDADAYPWAHVDMAGLAFIGSDKGYNPKGALGYGVRTLVELAKGN
jgi:leucyl aminopeptidase